MKNKKSYIDTYKTLYPVDIVVANETVTLEKLRKLYTTCEGTELSEEVMDCVASASRAKRISDDKYVILIKYNHPTMVKGIDKEADLVSTCAHEATHAALDIFEYIEEIPCTQHQETLAYLIEYVAACIYKTLRKK